MSRSLSMMRTARACSRCTGCGASGSTATSGPSIPRPASCSFCCTPISSSRSRRARVNSSLSVPRSAFASRSEKSRVGSGTSTGATYRMAGGTGSIGRTLPRPAASAARMRYVTVTSMLRELTGDERAAYFRAIQPIWGGGLSEERFQAFQRRLADATEAKDRYRLLGWFVNGTFASGMKTYDLRGTFAGKPLRLLGVGAVFTPPELRRRGYAAGMLRAAMAEWAAQGTHAAVLFSGIGARYYEHLGFRVLDSRECTVEASELPRPAGDVRPAMAGDEGLMSRLFAAARG